MHKNVRPFSFSVAVKVYALSLIDFVINIVYDLRYWRQMGQAVCFYTQRRDG